MLTTLVPRWEFQGKHKDGSLRVDIPLRQYPTRSPLSLQLTPTFSPPRIAAPDVQRQLLDRLPSQPCASDLSLPLPHSLFVLTAHIHLFHFAPRGSPGRPVSHRSGKGWRGGFFLSAAEQYLKLELTKNFRVCPFLIRSCQLC